MRTSRFLATTAVAALVGVWGFTGAGTGQAGSAVAAGQKVDNFELTDQNRLGHNLYSMAVDTKAIVIITQGNGCPVVRNNATAYNALQAAYKDKGVEFFMLNANSQDSLEDVQKEVSDFKMEFRVLQDINQLVAEQLKLERTGEVIVIDPKTWNIVFRGPVDDRVTYERQKAAATKTYAKDALDAFLAGRAVRTARVDAPGCLINLLDAKEDHSKISYVRDIAPIIQEKCVTCHQPGGIGPMTLVNYEQVKGHSLMIRETLRTKRMPPYHADPRVGHFSNDRSLSADQIKTMVHWIEAGSPRGQGADPLAGQTFVAKEWPLGTPDVVLNIPAYSIPANGIVDYQNPWAPMPADFEDRWLKASTIKVAQRQGVHHVLTGYLPRVPTTGTQTRGGGLGGPSVGGYAVGAESQVWPTDSGTYLTKGGAVGFQMHYTPFGRDAVDNTKIGLYFYPKGQTPTYIQHNSVIADQTIEITPNSNNWSNTAYMTFPADAKLFNVFPHAHYRGRSASVELQYPNGRKELIFSMPHYDFNWQGAYEFKEPLNIPAGTKMIAHMTFDNSARNPANPNKNETVRWGDQSFEEMFYMAFDYQWKAETSANRTPQFDQALNASRQFGIMDKNVNDKIEMAELNGRQFASLKPLFTMFDRNGDGGLDNAELAAAMTAGRGAPGGRPAGAAPAPGEAAMPPRPAASAGTRPQG